MSTTLITAAGYPDLDGVACAIAYAEYLGQKQPDTRYIAKFFNKPQIEPAFIASELDLLVEVVNEGEISKYDNFILVDMSEPKGLPETLDLDKVLEVIDHRMFPDYRSFPNAKFRVEPVGAAATQVAEFFYFDNDVQKLASTKLPGNITDQDIFSLHNVVMRKGIIKALKDAE